jgi:3'-phosphoadenosine 5'-phosphosulfate sulfotransferase (PAPS reductase)/FAD synthetase
MNYIARLSGGSASAVATERAIERYGRNRVTIYFNDTLWEDEDCYRFVRECMARWGGKLHTDTDGRNPLEVFEKKKLIPNSAMAPCSRELKIEMFEKYLWATVRPVTILSGLGWQEPQRIEKIVHYHKYNGKWRAPMGFARRIPGVYEDFPLLWKPLEMRPYQEVVRAWGIEPPRMYAYGFPHANCGGRCIRQGVAEWKRLWIVWPERFAEMRDWEQAQREKGGARAKAAICSYEKKGITIPITLAELETKWSTEGAGKMELVEYQDDRTACFCTDV